MAIDLGKMALRALKNKQQQDSPPPLANILEFAEAPWGLGNSGMTLFPVQRIVLKAHYGIPLDTNECGFNLEDPLPPEHPRYEEFAAAPEIDEVGNVLRDSEGRPIRYYKYRVKLDNWQRTSTKYVSEKEYMAFLHKEGRCNIPDVVPGQERRIMVLSLGRRSGKSFMASCILAYELYKLVLRHNPQKYYGSPKGQDIQLLTIATDMVQAGLLYQTVSGHFQNATIFKPYAANSTQRYARFQTPSDIENYGAYSDNEKAKSSLKITFAPAKSKALRGAANVVIIFDEFAHVIEHGADSAKNLFDSAGPSRSTFSPKDPLNPKRPIGEVEGRILMISTPMGKQGEFYAQYEYGFTGDPNYLCMQAPTWEVNPTIPASEFRVFHDRDPNVFFTEYGASFSDRTRGWIEAAADIDNCIASTAKPQAKGVGRTQYYLGFDLGLAGDMSAIAIGHVEPGNNPTIVVDLVDYIKAGEGKYENVDRLDFEAVADWVRDVCKRFRVTEGLFDSSSGIIMEQAMKKRGLSQIKMEFFTQNKSSDLYRNFKDLVIAGRVAFYNYPVEEGQTYCDYLQEILSLQETRISRNVTRVEAPRTKGSHDDRSDAICRMLWLATQAMAGYETEASRHARRQTLARNNARIATVSNMGNFYRGGSSPERQFIVGSRR